MIRNLLGYLFNSWKTKPHSRPTSDPFTFWNCHKAHYWEKWERDRGGLSAAPGKSALKTQDFPMTRKTSRGAIRKVTWTC